MTFEEDLGFGRDGEDAVYLMLLHSPKTKNVLDVTEDKTGYFYKKDIDFIQQTIDGQIIKYEVKTDSMAHKTGNIPYEIKSNNNKGCLDRSEADIVAFYLSATKQIYFVKLSEWKCFNLRKHYKPIKMGDNAEGFLVPINDLIENKIAYEFVRINGRYERKS